MAKKQCRPEKIIGKHQDTGGPITGGWSAYAFIIDL